MSFLGPTKDKRWREILESKDDLVNKVVTKILGDDFIETENSYRVNTDIPVVFVSILLVMGLKKFEATLLCQALFRKEILGDLNLVVDNVDEEMKGPYLEDYMVRDGQRVSREIGYKSLNGLLSLSMMTHLLKKALKLSIARNIEFLQMWLG